MEGFIENKAKIINNPADFLIKEKKQFVKLKLAKMELTAENAGLLRNYNELLRKENANITLDRDEYLNSNIISQLIRGSGSEAVMKCNAVFNWLI